MAKAEQKQKKIGPKEDTSYSEHVIGIHYDKIWKIATSTFKESDDRGFEFETSNFKFILRAKKEDYYSLIESLFSEVLDEFQNNNEDYNPLIDDFHDFLIAKMNGEL